MRFLVILLATAAIFCADVQENGQISFTHKAYAASDEGVTPEFDYHEMKPLMIPVINRGGISQQVSLVISIEVPHGNLDKVSLYEPRLADAYIQDLYGVLGTGYGLVNGKVLDVPTIKSRLKAVAQRVLGEDVAHDVLLHVVQQRPL